MLWRQFSPVAPGRSEDWRVRHRSRVQWASSRTRRQRPKVECLEGRQLLAPITEFSLPAGGSLTVGPDGNLWFRNAVSVGRITPSGVFADFPLSTPDTDYSSDPGASALTAGPDGNLWFPEGDRIGRITPSGTITEFPLPPPVTTSEWMTAGPDGNLWFREGDSIGRITPSGTITEFPFPSTRNYFVSALTVGPDGNLWFPLWFPNGFDGSRHQCTRSIGSRHRAAITVFPGSSGMRVYAALTAGPDGNLWFPGSGFGPLSSTGFPSPFVARITPSGTITEFPLPNYVANECADGRSRRQSLVPRE